MASNPTGNWCESWIACQSAIAYHYQRISLAPHNGWWSPTYYSQFSQWCSNSSRMVCILVLPSSLRLLREGNLGSLAYSLLYAPQIASLQAVTMATIRAKCMDMLDATKCGGASLAGNHVTWASGSCLTVAWTRWRKGSGSSIC